jgi:putative glutamine amidotransferase
MRLETDTNRFYLGRDYSEALAGLGAVPFHLSLIPDRQYISESLKNLDGILLPGSDTDVDPLRFGEEPHTKLKKIIWEKEETDLLVLDEAEKLNLPVLGICFGMQILNVWREGTLIQDIESQISNSIKHEQGQPLARNSHTLVVEEKSLISTLSEVEKPVVNSHHHQAINKLGRNLRATSWTKDGVIESIEDTQDERFILGVQWHPELSWKTDKLSKNIFETFINECFISK